MARLRRQGSLFHREALVLGGSIAYSHTFSQWRELMLATTHCDGGVPAAKSEYLEPLRMGIQSEASDFFTSWLPPLRALRAKGSSCGEVREPSLPTLFSPVSLMPT